MRCPRVVLVLLSVGALALAILGVAAVSATASSAHRPTGVVQSVARTGNLIRITGWASDADAAGAATVNASIDGVRKATVAANQARAHSSKPSGFAIYLRSSSGIHRVCVSVDDYPSFSARVFLLCTFLNFDHDPIGGLTSLTQSSGRLTAHGWAIDRDTPRQTQHVVVFADRRPVASGPAALPVPGLSATHPVAGNNHGFALSFPISEGTHSVCLEVINSGAGSSRTVNCVDPWTVSFSPSGVISSITQVPGGIHVTGYASDPDTAATTTVSVTSDGHPLGTVAANQASPQAAGHGFSGSFSYHWIPLKPVARLICVTAKNLGAYGHDRSLGCLTRTFNWNPSVGVDALTQHVPGGGALVTGWASDPDTSKPISVRLTEGSTTLATVPANSATGTHAGHSFSAVLPLAQGTHTVCATALNVGYGIGNSAPTCRSVKLDFNPYGIFESTSRAPGSSDVIATGWAVDPDTTGPIPIRARVDNGALHMGVANISRADIGRSHPVLGAAHGFAVRLPADANEHSICTSAVNVGGGSIGWRFLGCKTIAAVHPNPPAAPTRVSAVGGYGGANIAWSAPTSDGGAPRTSYTVRALPSGPSITVGPTVLSTTLLGLRPNTRYTFSVVANNAAGSSAAGTSNAVVTQKAPPAQTTPAPVSTSRYIRNVRGASSSDLAAMRREGAADAARNPSGHGYLVVLAVGGQDESRHGVILTAGIRYVSYADMVRDLDAYVDGYASQQRLSAPVMLAIATNNDIDVSGSSGASFANNIVDPVRAHAARYAGITIAGSDDMEPGFRAGYNATRSWLGGFLGATAAPFVFTGSADGCAWTRTFGSCNNGWTAGGMYYLAGGANPIRQVNLPQIYNSTMAQQWRYISLTGVQSGRPKINFGGALTEYTACGQAGSCGSLTGPTAWSYLWNALRAESSLRPASLPYSTDLRIDS